MANALPEWKDYAPGARVPLQDGIPCEPYTELADKAERKRIAEEIEQAGAKPRTHHLIHILERGAALSEHHGFGTDNIVLCTYDNTEKNGYYLERAARNTNFISPEAAKFTKQLYQNGVDASKMTFVGWSYGTSFMQQVATAMQPKHSEDILKIHAMGVACVADKDTMQQRGFPGIYMYGLNDTVIPEFIREAQVGMLGFFALLHQAQAQIAEMDPSLDKQNIFILRGQEQDQIFLLSNIPTTVNRYRRLPEGKVTAERSHISQPDFENETAHAPVGFMEAIEGSYYFDKRGMKVQMHEHANIFRTMANVILARNERVNCVTTLSGYHENEESRKLALRERGIIEIISITDKTRDPSARIQSTYSR